MTLVAGVDSSTQSCKVVIVDGDDGTVVRSGSASHPDGTEVDPQAWSEALGSAIEAAGGLDDVEALSVGGQQHGLVALDADGEVIRPALLWNDTRSAGAAADLVDELGAAAWAEATGSVPVASLTVAKLRWLADHEPEHASRLAAVALPHDWLTLQSRTGRWQDSGRLGDLVTDRSDASGTGYLSPDGTYRRDLLTHALRRDADSIVLPRVLEPAESVEGPGYRLGAGCGDNAGAALGLGLTAGQTSISIGTSGVVAAVSETGTRDASGLVTGFLDATGRHLPLACTLNGARILDATARLLGVDHDGLDELALAASPGAEGLVLVPYLEGERTPNLPLATGSLAGVTGTNLTRENLARAAVEGLWCLLAEALQALRDQGVAIESAVIVGGGARSRAVQQIGPRVVGIPMTVPEPAEYVALGAARQAAWVLAGGAEPPAWPIAAGDPITAEHDPSIVARYREAAAGVIDRASSPTDAS